MRLVFALVLTMFPNFSRAEGQILIPKAHDEAHVVACNEFEHEATLERYVQGQKEEIATLQPGECVSEILRDLSALSNTPYYIVRTDDAISLIENPQVKESGFDWEKLIYLLAGAVLASLKGLFETVVHPVVSAVRLRLQLLAFRTRLIEDLNTHGLTIEFDKDLDDALASSRSHLFVGKKMLRKISDLKSVYQRVEAKDLSNFDAIKHLQGKV